MKMRSMKSIILFLLTSMLFMACNQDIVFNKNKKIPEGLWHKDSLFKFQVEINDTIPRYDIFIHIRNTTAYPYSNFYFFVNTHFPDGRLFRDTVECALARPDGAWNGKGFGKIKSNTFLYRTGVWFPQNGIYEFSLEHGMRVDAISDITDVGIKIEKQ